MRNVLAPLFLALLACNDPAVQPFGPSELPTPDAPTPTPIIYQVSVMDVVSESPGNFVYFHVTLEITHNENIVTGASVYLWASTGSLSVSEHETTDAQGRVELTWEVPPTRRVILSACATQSLSPPCQPTVVMVRHT